MMSKLVSIENKQYEAMLEPLLHSLGFMDHLRGTKYIRQAVLMVMMNEERLLIKQIYSAIASSNKTTFSRIERNIRHAIQVAYKRSESSIYQEYFGIGQNKAPSNSQVIYTLARKVGTIQ